jgi:hypothetical protein
MKKYVKPASAIFPNRFFNHIYHHLALYIGHGTYAQACVHPFKRSNVYVVHNQQLLGG